METCHVKVSVWLCYNLCTQLRRVVIIKTQANVWLTETDWLCYRSFWRLWLSNILATVSLWKCSVEEMCCFNANYRDLSLLSDGLDKWMHSKWFLIINWDHFYSGIRLSRTRARMSPIYYWRGGNMLCDWFLFHPAVQTLCLYKLHRSSCSLT